MPRRNGKLICRSHMPLPHAKFIERRGGSHVKVSVKLVSMEIIHTPFWNVHISWSVIYPPYVASMSFNLQIATVVKMAEKYMKVCEIIYFLIGFSLQVMNKILWGIRSWRRETHLLYKYDETNDDKEIGALIFNNVTTTILSFCDPYTDHLKRYLYLEGSRYWPKML